MARIAMDTRAQNSWKELIEKEAATRIQCKLKLEEAKKNEDEWFVRSKYTQVKPMVQLGSTQQSSEEQEKSEYMKPIAYPPRPVRKNLSDEIERLSEQLRLSGANLLSDMRAPPDDVRATLYDGFSKEGKGRSKYLRARKSDDPEVKYEYPLVSSFDYGWKLNETGKEEYRNPVHGRNKIVEDSFYRRNGVF